MSRISVSMASTRPWPCSSGLPSSCWPAWAASSWRKVSAISSSLLASTCTDPDVRTTTQPGANARVPSIQSRADAALCGQTYVFLLPGSTGGVKLGVEKILIPQLDHRLKPCNFVMLLPRIKNEKA